MSLSTRQGITDRKGTTVESRQRQVGGFLGGNLRFHQHRQ